MVLIFVILGGVNPKIKNIPEIQKKSAPKGITQTISPPIIISKQPTAFLKRVNWLISKAIQTNAHQSTEQFFPPLNMLLIFPSASNSFKVVTTVFSSKWVDCIIS